jgi:VanZ family protein
MFDAPPREPEWRSWLWVGAGAGIIFATVPVARRIADAVDEAAGAELFRVAVLALLGLGALLAGRALRRARRLGPVRLAWIVGIAALYALATVTLCQRPEEAVHFVQYGGLAVLAFRALGHRLRDASIYVASAAAGASFGILDEAIQWLTPGRVWDLRDLGLNTLGASLVQPALAFGVRPPWVAPRVGARGAAIAALALAVPWTLFGASVLLTPPRIARLADLPGVASTVARGDVMLEYGHLVEDPEIGVFRSRLSPEALRRTDRARAAEAGAILRREGAEEDYEAFLQRYNPITDPFLHELRVHLFRRDRYRATAENHPDDERWYRSDLTVAWRENRILERYFGATLEAAGLRWAEDERATVAGLQFGDRPYTSRVSSGLVTAVDPGTVAAGWLAGLVLLAAGAALGAQRARAQARAAARPAALTRPGSS